MSVDRRLVNMGVFLLILGGIPLAVGQGWLARGTIAQAWELWPLILIGVGLGLILRRTPFHFVGGLLVAATFGTILGAVLAGGLGLGTLGCGEEHQLQAFEFALAAKGVGNEQQQVDFLRANARPRE